MGRERAYAGLQRIHKKAFLSLITFLILIKDYSGDMSKNCREKLEKQHRNRQTVNKIYIDISIKLYISASWNETPTWKSNMFTQPTDLFKFTQHKQKNISVHFHCCPVNFAELSTTLTLSERGNIYTTRDMNWDPLPETRCKYNLQEVGSAENAGAVVGEQLPRSKKPAMRHTVSGDGSHSMLLSVNGTAVIYFINLRAPLLIAYVLCVTWSV